MWKMEMSTRILKQNSHIISFNNRHVSDLKHYEALGPFINSSVFAFYFSPIKLVHEVRNAATVTLETFKSDQF